MNLFLKLAAGEEELISWRLAEALLLTSAQAPEAAVRAYSLLLPVLWRVSALQG